jgi:hypothetical protein
MNELLSFKLRTSLLLPAIAIAIVMLSIADGFGAEPSVRLLDIDWTSLKKEGRLQHGEIAGDEGTHKQLLKIESPGPTAGGMPRVVSIAEIKVPPISKPVFMISGSVRYNGIEGTPNLEHGFLEMWSLFPDGSHYFSRTLDPVGPMGWISGSSDWRPVAIPFQLGPDPKSPRPDRLLLNFVLPGKGTVWLSDLTLTESDTLIFPGRSAALDYIVGGLIAALVAVVLIAGALVTTILAARGIARGFVIGTAGAGIALGILLVVLGVVIAARGLPGAISHPLTIVGGLCAVASAVGLFLFRRRYVRFELRRMEAFDVE